MFFLISRYRHISIDFAIIYYVYVNKHIIVLAWYTCKKKKGMDFHNVVNVFQFDRRKEKYIVHRIVFDWTVKITQDNNM